MKLCDEDFPARAIGKNVHLRRSLTPICECVDEDAAIEIAKRLNRDNQVYPEDDDRGSTP